MAPDSRALVFVVGCPRSGTYMMSSILGGTGDVAIPTETHFAPLFQRFISLAGNLKDSGNRVRLVRGIFCFLRIWLVRAEEERDWATISRHSLLVIEPEARGMAERAVSYPQIVHGLFAAYAGARGAKRYGDKSAFFNHVPLDDLDAAAGGRAVFVHVIRDGRDVCLSWTRIRTGPSGVAEAAAAWRKHVLEKRRWGRLHPDRYLEVRYEDILGFPERELQRLCRFVQIPYSTQLLDFYRQDYAMSIADSSTHAMLRTPLNPANRDKWKGEMPESQLREFEAVARDALLEFGYAPGLPEDAKRPGVFQRFGNCLRRAACRISVRSLRLTLKDMLPAVILICMRVGFPLDRLCNSRPWLGIESLVVGRRGGRRRVTRSAGRLNPDGGSATP